MPTGYTADIAKGISFEQFAMNCARAFGACITMRDDPADTPIPERFVPSDYHAKAIDNCRAKIQQLQNMSAAEMEATAASTYREAMSAHQKRLNENLELRNKYNAMLAQVVKWTPPTKDHVNFKEFMLSQIRESIDWDCSEKYVTAPTAQTGEEWHAAAMAEARRSLAYHIKENEEEIARANSRTGWVQALRTSLMGDV